MDIRAHSFFTTRHRIGARSVTGFIDSKGVVLAPSLNLLGVDFLSVPAVIRVARDMTLCVSDKGDASYVTLYEERFRTQG